MLFVLFYASVLRQKRGKKWGREERAAWMWSADWQSLQLSSNLLPLFLPNWSETTNISLFTGYEQEHRSWPGDRTCPPQVLVRISFFLTVFPFCLSSLSRQQVTFGPFLSFASQLFTSPDQSVRVMFLVMTFDLLFKAQTGRTQGSVTKTCLPVRLFLFTCVSGTTALMALISWTCGIP